MRWQRQRPARMARQAGIGLVVLLLHLALLWVFLRPQLPHPAPEDGRAFEVVLLPPEHSNAAGDERPRIAVRLRVPPLPTPDENALQIPLEVPVEVPTEPEPVTPVSSR